MKFFKLLATLAIATVILSSCGSSKSTVKQYRKSVDEDVCVTLVHKKPETRVWGFGSAFKINDAYDLALSHASSNMAARIKSVTEKLVDYASIYHDKGTKSSKSGAMSVQDQEGSQGTSHGLNAENVIVSGLVEIEQSLYECADGTYECYVCLEYRDGIEKMEEKIMDDVYQRIPEEDKKAIDQNIEDFRQRIRDSLRENIR